MGFVLMDCLVLICGSTGSPLGNLGSGREARRSNLKKLAHRHMCNLWFFVGLLLDACSLKVSIIAA